MAYLVLVSCVVFVIGRLRWRVPGALRGPPPAARESGERRPGAERKRAGDAARVRVSGRPGGATMRAWRHGA